MERARAGVRASPASLISWDTRWIIAHDSWLWIASLSRNAPARQWLGPHDASTRIAVGPPRKTGSDVWYRTGENAEDKARENNTKDSYRIAIINPSSIHNSLISKKYSLSVTYTRFILSLCIFDHMQLLKCHVTSAKSRYWNIINMSQYTLLLNNWLLVMFIAKLSFPS